MIEDVVGQYLGPVKNGEGAHQDFDQVVQGLNATFLASGLSAMLSSEQTPAFARIVEETFRSGTSDQKAAILGAIRGIAITPQQAMAVRPMEVAQLAIEAERVSTAVVERVAAVLAQYPALIKTLGTGPLVVALREIAHRYPIG
jgi:hypothetical protein